MRAKVLRTPCSRATMHATIFASELPVSAKNTSQLEIPSSFIVTMSLDLAVTITASGNLHAISRHRSLSGSITVIEGEIESSARKSSNKFSVTRPAPVIIMLLGFTNSQENILRTLTISSDRAEV